MSKIPPNFRKIVYLSRIGMTGREIAAHFGIDPSTISHYRKRHADAWKQQHLTFIDEYIQGIDQQLQDLQDECYEVVDEEMNALIVCGLGIQRSKLEKERLLVIKGESPKLEGDTEEKVGKGTLITSVSLLKVIRQSKHQDYLIDLILSR